MKNSEISWEEALNWASHFYLTEQFPKGFSDDWGSEKILTHIRRNSSIYYAGWRSELLWERIRCVAESVSRDCSWQTEARGHSAMTETEEMA